MCNSNRLCNDNDCQICFNKSFASHAKAEFWSEKNGDVKPRQVLKSLLNKYWFNCTCGHQFNSSLYSITRINTWCPYCCIPPLKLCENEDCKSCLEKSFALHPKAEFWSDINRDQPEGYNGLFIHPRKIFNSSNTKYWFNCDCGHQFNSTLQHITCKKQNTWCPYCCIPHKKLCEKKDCKSCLENSFALHPKAEFWSDKNGDIKPRQVLKSSKDKFWFNCVSCGHEFNVNLNMLTRNEKQWCSYCAHRQLCENKECKTCFEKSFASHIKAKFWSDKNGHVKPRQVFKSSNTKYWFNCDCGHEFETCLCNITSLKPSWCYYCCSPSKRLCEKKDCKTCFKKSFASHPKAEFWSEKNGYVKPRQVCNGSDVKYWFNCVNGHEFNASLSNISHNKWCPICVNKTEKKLYEQLLQIYPNLNPQFRIDWCKNPNTDYFLPFDFVLKEQKIIIELDGIQHFKQVMNWKSPEEQFENDQYKEKSANDNGYSVIRILQTDVLYDTYDWLNELKDSIEQIVNEKVIQNIYLCMNNEYENFN
jgi:very-short-patch-repair endonuclease